MYIAEKNNSLQFIIIVMPFLVATRTNLKRVYCVFIELAMLKFECNIQASGLLRILAAVLLFQSHFPVVTGEENITDCVVSRA